MSKMDESAALKAKRAYQRKWQQENRDKVREYNRRWRTAHPDKAKEYQTRWRTNHPEAARECQRRYWMKRAEREAALKASQED